MVRAVFVQIACLSFINMIVVVQFYYILIKPMFLRKLFIQHVPCFRVAFGFAKGKKDLYQTLGVTKSASQSQIKKAYYKLAQEFHPDKNPSPTAKDKFAEVNNAYQVLSDQSKRNMYDQTGSTDDNPYSGFENQDIFNQFRGGFAGGRRGSHHNINPEDFQSIFEDLFGGMGGGNKRSRGKNNYSGQDPSQDIVVKCDLQFSEAVNGTSKTIQYKKRSTCHTCHGSKAKPGTKPQKCGGCQGTGYMTFHQGIMIMRMECQRCHGSGQTIGTPCTTCSGQGFQTGKAHQQIKFPRGIDNGGTLKFKGKGHLSGDLIIKITVRNHPLFKRQGNDALIERQISVIDAILGADIDTQTIYGQTKKVKVPAGTQSGDKIKLHKQGFYRLNTTDKGNQVITLKVKIPTKISSQEKQLYQKLKETMKS